MAKSLQKLQARKLRRIGKSIGEIARELKVSKSSASLWCSDIELTPEQITNLIKREGSGAAKGRQIAARLRKAERKQRVDKFCDIGLKKIGHLTNRERFLVGAALYWAEGSKKTREVMFANSEPEMILLFLRWLTKNLLIPSERIYCRIGVNQEHEERASIIEQYWSRVTGVPMQRFKKTILRKVKIRKIYENPDDYYGTLYVTVKCGTNLNYEILGYIEGLKLAA